MGKLCENKIVLLQGDLGVCPKYWSCMFLVFAWSPFTYGLVELLAEERKQKVPLIACPFGSEHSWAEPLFTSGLGSPQATARFFQIWVFWLVHWLVETVSCISG